MIAIALFLLLAIPIGRAQSNDSATTAAQFGGQRLNAPALADKTIEKALLDSGIGYMAVQSDGIATSLRTFAEIQINLVTGNNAVRGQDPVYTLLAMIYRGEDWHKAPIVPVASARLSKALGLNPRTQARISLNWALSDDRAVGLLSETENGRVEDKTLARPLEKLRGRLLTLKTLPEELKILPIAAEGDAWISISELQHPGRVPESALAAKAAAIDTTTGAAAAALALDQALHALFERGQATGLGPAVTSLLAAAQNTPSYMPGWARSLDHFHTSAKPFHQAARLFLVGALLSLIVMATKRNRKPATGPDDALSADTTAAEPQRRATPLWAISLAVLVLAEVALVDGLVNRGLLTARMPVANMYESLLFTLAAFGLAGIIFEIRSRMGWLGFVTAVMQGLLLTFVNNLPAHMTRREPLVAVLDSLWLNFHVTTVMISYGLFLLGFLFCVLYLFKDFTGNRKGVLPDKEAFEYLNYRCIQIGWPLLGIGIFLGAVWANTAWGSYWNWDPKETWSLITWLAYAVYLHLRMNAGWTGRRSVIASMVGFLMVLITYFGVTYLPGLAGGLHSYA